MLSMGDTTPPVLRRPEEDRSLPAIHACEIGPGFGGVPKCEDPAPQFYWATVQLPGPGPKPTARRKMVSAPSTLKAKGWRWWRLRVCHRHLRVAQRSRDTCPLDTHVRISDQEQEWLLDLYNAGWNSTNLSELTGYPVSTTCTYLRWGLSRAGAPRWEIRRHLVRHADDGHMTEADYRKALREARLQG